MSPAFAIGILIWVVTFAYAGVQSGLQEIKHCQLSVIGALKGSVPNCSPASGGSGPPPPGSGGSGGGQPPGIHPPLPSTNAAKHIAQTKLRFPTGRFNGCFCCRKIGDHGCPPPGGFGGGDWSQHAWANAVDYVWPSGAAMQAYGSWAEHQPGVANFFYNEPFALATHVDFLPAGQGTPPCANGNGQQAPAQGQQAPQGNVRPIGSGRGAGRPKVPVGGGA